MHVIGLYANVQPGVSVEQRRGLVGVSLLPLTLGFSPPPVSVSEMSSLDEGRRRKREVGGRKVRAEQEGISADVWSLSF